MNGANNPVFDDVRCAEFVEMVTSYLDDALPVEVRSAIDAHLAGCEGCRHALEQWRTVIRLSAQLTAADVTQVDAYTRERLMATFHRVRPR